MALLSSGLRPRNIVAARSLTCQQCGADFVRRPSAEQRFCSSNCYHGWRATPGNARSAAIGLLGGRDIDAEALRQALHYDPNTGAFKWIVKPSPRMQAGSPVGSPDKDGYLRVQIAGKTHKLHRLAWLYMTGAWPVDQVDHINGDKADNRWNNLRDVPNDINQQNRRTAQRTSKTGVIGVAVPLNARNKFTARIRVKGKSTFLGSFDTLEAAADAYVEAKRRLHAGCTL